MGYRSCVRIKTTEEGYARLVRIADDLADKAGLDAVHGVLLSSACAPKVEVHDGGEVVFGWDWIRFYESFSDVSHLLDVLEEARDGDIPYQMLRIGENIEDVEERSNVCDGEDFVGMWVGIDPCLPSSRFPREMFEDWLLGRLDPDGRLSCRDVGQAVSAFFDDPGCTVRLWS